ELRGVPVVLARDIVRALPRAPASLELFDLHSYSHDTGPLFEVCDDPRWLATVPRIGLSIEPKVFERMGRTALGRTLVRVEVPSHPDDIEKWLRACRKSVLEGTTRAGVRCRRAAPNAPWTIER